MIPGIFNNLQFSSQKLLRTKDEAKNDAAEFFLMQLFPPTCSYMQPNSASLNQDQSVFYGTNQNVTHLIPSSSSANNANNNNNNNSSNNTGLSNGISSSPSTNTSNNNSNMETSNNLYANANRQINDFNIGLLQQQQQLVQPQFIYDPSGMKFFCKLNKVSNHLFENKLFH